jgi:Tfp pilus assembly pilus retraction ATPase PilT
MDMLPTLCAAMKRAGGDALVLRTGESPHVLTGGGRQNVARAVLSANALEALVTQIFSAAARHTLSESGHVVEEVTVSGGLVLTASADRTAEHVTIELRESAPAPVEAVSDPEPEPAAEPAAVAQQDAVVAPVGDSEPQQWFEVSLGGTTEGAFEAVPSFAISADPAELREAPVHEIAPTEIEPLESATVQYEELFLQVPPATAVAEDVVPEYTAAPEFTAASSDHADTPEPQAATWSFSHPLASESFERPLPAYEEPPVNASDLQFVEPPSTDTGASMNQPIGLTAWATRAAERGATALYLRSGATPLARVEDRLEPLSADAVDNWRFEELVTEFNNGRSSGWELGSHGEMSWQLPSVGQVSCWSFSDDQGAGLMMRLRLQQPTRSLLKVIPRRVRAACDGDGLIVVSAPTTADVAAVTATVGDLAGRQRGGYVISLRAAGAARHDISGAFVSQREFNGSDGDIAAAIRSAASELPDVLIVAPPTSEAAMREVVNAAEGGRLVILGVLAPTSMQALRAIVGRGSAGGDAQTRLALATSFRVAFAYRLFQRLGGGRVVVRDLVVGTSEVSAMLASGDFPGIARLQREGGMSMTTVDDSLARAVRRGQLSLRQAAAHAVDKKYLVGLVRSNRRQSPAASDAPAASGNRVLEPVSSSRQRWSSY